MTHRQQIESFCGDLEAVIDRYRKEYDLPVASAVGCLQILVHKLIAEAMEDEDAEN